MTRSWIAVLVFVPVAYTAASVAAARSNRSTDRVPIVLTQREAEAPFRNDENSAMRLRLAWQPPLYLPPTWFNRDKLGELGFDVSVDPMDRGAERHYGRMLPRQAFVALEYNGPAWETWVTAAERTAPDGQRQAPPDIRDYATRLIVVDAARAAETLAQRYPNGRTHLITAAVVRLNLMSLPAARPPYLSGSIVSIDPDEVYVPRDLAGQLPLRDRNDGRLAPYQVTIGYGTRWEPYVIAVSSGAASQ